MQSTSGVSVASLHQVTVSLIDQVFIKRVQKYFAYDELK